MATLKILSYSRRFSAKVSPKFSPLNGLGLFRNSKIFPYPVQFINRESVTYATTPSSTVITTETKSIDNSFTSTGHKVVHSSFSDSGAEEIVTIDVHKAYDFIRSGSYRYLDVRTEEEFKKGHVDVENPLNIAYMFNTPEGRVKNPNFLEQVVAVCSKDDHLVVGCQLGIRSVYATTDLQNNEFKHVYNMGGGYQEWVKNGLPVIEPQVENDLPDGI